MKNLFKISLILFILDFQSCSRDSNHNIIQKVDSPDGNLIATVFTTKGDATVPLGVDVCLSGKDDVIPARGNVFRGSHSEHAQVFWIDNKNLVISTDAEVFLLMKEYSGVTFELRRK